MVSNAESTLNPNPELGTVRDASCHCDSVDYVEHKIPEPYILNPNSYIPKF